MMSSPAPLAAVLLLALLSGCGSTSGSATPGGNAEPATVRDYPRGAAAVLSVVGSGARPPEAATSPFDAATNCVVALRTVRTLLSRLPERPSSQQMQMLDRAEKAYLDRAQTAAGDAVRAADEIEQKLDGAQDAPTAQAQLALACVKDLS
jgi:hypothetical protein